MLTACLTRPAPVAGPPAVALPPAPPGRHLLACPAAEPPRPIPLYAATAGGPIEPVFQAIPDANAMPVTVSPDGSLFAWLGWGGHTLNVSETGSGACRGSFSLDPLSWGDLLRWSPDGRWILASDGRRSLIVDLAEGGAEATVEGEIGDAVWTSPEELRVTRAEGRLERIDARGASLGWAGEPAPAPGLGAIHPSGRFLAVVEGGTSGPLAIVDGETATKCGRVGLVPDRAADALSWSPNGRYVAVLGSNLSVTVYDAETGGLRVSGKVPYFRHHRVWSLAWGEGGEVLSVASGGWITRWDAGRGVTPPPVRFPVGREGDGFAIAAAPSGKDLLAFGAGAALVVDAESGARTAALPAPRPVSLAVAEVVLGTTPRVAVAYDEGVVLWDLGAGKLVSVLEQESVAQEEGFILFGSPDGKTVGYLSSPHGVYTGPDRGRILLWDGETGASRGRMHADAFSDAPVWLDGGARFVWSAIYGSPSVFDARTLRKVRALPPQPAGDPPAVAPRALPVKLPRSGCDGPGAFWLGPRVCATLREDRAGLELLRISDGEVVRVRFSAVGDRAGYLAYTRRGIFDLQGLPPEGLRFRDGRDVAHAPLLTVEQVKGQARPGLVGDLIAGRSVLP